MKAAPVRTIMSAQKELEDEGQQYWGPRTDGYIFPGTNEEMAARRYPFQMMIGTSLHENGIPVLARLMPDKFPQGSIKESCLQVIQQTAIKHPRIVSLLCTREYSNGTDRDQSVLKMVDDVQLFAPTYTDAKYMAKAGGPVYLWSFDFVKKGMEGVFPFHAIDSRMMFGKHDEFLPGVPFDEEDEAITAIDISLMSDFTKYGNPTPPGSQYSTWQELQDPTGYNYYTINLPKPKNDPFYHYYAVNFWDNIVPQVERSLDSNSVASMAEQKIDIIPEGGSTQWQLAFWITLGVGIAIFLALILVAVVIFRSGVTKRRNRFEQYLDREEKRALLTAADM